MLLHQRLREDLKQALKTGNKARVSALRLLLAGIANAEIAKGAPLDDEGVMRVIAKEVKQCRESIEAFRKGERQDLVNKEEVELKVLLEYLPQQMSREEIITAAHQVMEEVKAKAPSDKGKVMSKLMPQLKGKADGRVVSDIVSELLANL